MVPDPLEQFCRHFRQFDPLDRRGVEVEGCEYDVEQLVTERHQDAGIVGEGFRVQADVALW